MPKLGRRKTVLLIIGVVALLVLAWWQGGERALRSIEQDIAVPEGVL